MVSNRTWFPTFASTSDASASQSVMPSRLMILVDVFPGTLQGRGRLDPSAWQVWWSLSYWCCLLIHPNASLLGPRTRLALQHLTHQRTIVMCHSGYCDALETSFIDMRTRKAGGYGHCTCYISQYHHHAVTKCSMSSWWEATATENTLNCSGI